MSKFVHCLLALSFAAAPTAGCTSVYRFDTQQLDELDDYEYQHKSMGEEVMEGVGVRESNDPQLVLDGGDFYEFDGEDPLVLFVQADHSSAEPREIEYLYVTIDVSKDKFVGEPRSRDTITVQRADIEAAGVRQFSWGRTALLTGGIAATLFGGLLTLVAVSDGSGSGDGGGGD